MKCLIIFSGNTISGAEFVLQGYLRNTKNPNIEFYAVCSSKRIKEFLVNSGLKPENIFLSFALSQLGSKKSGPVLKVILLITKLILVAIGRLHVQIISGLKKIDVILGKNTYDSLYLPLVKGRRRIVLYVHDIVKNDPISAYVRRIIEKKVDTVIAVSNEVKSSIGQKLEDKVVVIYNGIKKLENQPVCNYEHKLVWVGSIERRKNPIEFVEIVRSLNQNGMHIKGVVIYKYYEKDLLVSVMDEISGKEYIEIKHDLTREEVFKEISTSLALVITSIEDPLPTVVLESYSLGVPVISANRSGMREMILDYQTGILYSSVEEIANRWSEIVNFLTNERHKIVDNINNILDTRFSIDNQVKQIDSIILGSSS